MKPARDPCHLPALIGALAIAMCVWLAGCLIVDMLMAAPR